MIVSGVWWIRVKTCRDLPPHDGERGVIGLGEVALVDETGDDMAWIKEGGEQHQPDNEDRRAASAGDVANKPLTDPYK